MANGVQLATAYVSLNVNTKDLGNQIRSTFKSMQNQGSAAGLAIGSNMAGGMRRGVGKGSAIFSGIQSGGMTWAATAGAAIGRTLKGALIGALGGLGLGSVFGIGGILSSGLDRLSTLQKSGVQLSLKLNESEIARLQKQITDVVKGTPIALDEAMAAVPKAINRGLNTSQAAQLVKDLADLAASTGDANNFSRLAVILDQVAAKSKLTGEEMMQLVDAGVDVRGMLKEAFRWDDATLEKNLKANKVGINELQTAIQKTFGAIDAGNGKTGLAQKLGETFEGSVKGLKAAAARLGADFISAIVGKESSQDPLKDFAVGVNAITVQLDKAAAWVKENRGEIRGFFVTARDIVLGVADALKTVIKFLKDNRTVAAGVAAAYASWKVVSITASVADNLSRALQLANRLNRTKVAPATGALGGSTVIAAGGGGGGARRAGRFGAAGRLGGKALRAVPFIGTAAILYDILTEIPVVRDLTDQIPGWFAKAKKAVSDAFTSTNVKKFFNDAKQSAADFIRNMSSTFSTGVQKATNSIKDKLNSAVDAVKKKWDSIFGESGWFATQFKRLGDIVDKVRDVLGLGPATAQASPGTTPFNPGPRVGGGSAGEPSRGSSVGGGGGMTGRFGGGISGTPGPPMSGSLAVAGSEPNRGPQKPPEAAGITEPRKVGSDKNLLQETVALKDRLTTMFPEVETVHGYRPPDQTQWGTITEHSSGKAFDVMVPSQLMDPKTGMANAQGLAWGDRLAKEALAQGASVLWRQSQYDPDGSVTKMGDRGNPTQNHWDHVHVLTGSYANFASGGKVRGAGTGTSDSIPAMLSNGEHVLTAKDVQAMGGQNEVYAFRAALQQGMIPGFAPGGDVDIENQNQLRDLQKRAEIAREQQRELPEDATDMDKLQAQIELDRSRRAATQFEQDMPFTMSGQTPPDRSLENRILDATEDLRLAQQARFDAGERTDTVPYSDMLQLNYAVVQAQRERAQAIAELNERNSPGNFLGEFTRSGGFLPTAAANTGVAGTSSLAGILNLGNEAVGGLIDTGASLIQSAVSAASMAGTAGAGAAAGPAAGAAASYGIQLAAGVAKRLSSFGFQAASIGADALIAQLMPFGAPRWLGYDYTGFMPQLGFQEAALTSIEKMGQDAINRQFGNQFEIPAQPQSPESALADPESSPPMMRMSMEVPGAAPATGQFGGMGQNSPGMDPTGTFTPEPWRLPQIGGGGGSWAGGGEVKIYDKGGILKPGELALNASRRPEKVLTDKQWDSLAKIQPANQSGPLVKIDAIYGMSPEDVATQIESKQRLAMMRFAGRP